MTCGRTWVTWLLTALALVWTIAPVVAAPRDVTYSAQYLAFAPNAGGQRVFALRQATDQREIGVFMNEDLLSGNMPIMGALYDWRFPICDQRCWLQSYIQGGLGLSTAGPLMELTWGVNLLWTVRLDVTTHAFITTNRLVLWSVPLWVGLSVKL